MTSQDIHSSTPTLVTSSPKETTRVGGIQYNQGLVKNKIITTSKGRKLNLSKYYEFNGSRITTIHSGFCTVGQFILVPRKSEHGLLTELKDYPLKEQFLQSHPQLRVLDAETEVTEKIQELNDTMTRQEVKAFLGMEWSSIVEYQFGRYNARVSLLEDLGIDPINYQLFKGEKQSIPTMVPKIMTVELAEFLGLLLSDGRIRENTILFYNNSISLRDRFKELLFKLFGLKAKDGYEKTVHAVLSTSKALRLFLEFLGVPIVRKSNTCFIPRFIQADMSFIAAYLSGHIAGDGSFYGYTLEFGTSSPRMCEDIGTLISMMGVIYRSRSKQDPGYKKQYRIFIDGIEVKKFTKFFGNYTYYDKVQKMFDYTSNRTNFFQGFDVIPLDPELLRSIGRSAFRGNKKAINAYDNVVYSGQNITLKTLETLIETSASNGVELLTLQSIHNYFTHYYRDKIVNIN